MRNINKTLHVTLANPTVCQVSFPYTDLSLFYAIYRRCRKDALHSWPRDKRGCLFQSFPILTVHSDSHSLSQVQRGLPAPPVIPILSRSPLPFPYDISIYLSSHLLLFFGDIMKPETTKLTTNGSLLVSETTENRIKNANAQIGSLFCNIDVSFNSISIVVQD